MSLCEKKKSWYSKINCICNFIIQICNVAGMCLSVYGLPSVDDIGIVHVLIISTIFTSTVCMSLKQSLNLETRITIESLF